MREFQSQILTSLEGGVKKVSEISAETGIAERTVRFYGKRLEEAGLITRVKGFYGLRYDYWRARDYGYQPLSYYKSPVFRNRLVLLTLTFLAVEILAYALGRGLL